MIGQNAATDPVEQFLEPIKDLQRRVADLERLAGRPVAGICVAQAFSNTASAALAGSVVMLSAPSFTAVAGRRYKITISWGGTIQVGVGQSEVQIWRAGVQRHYSIRQLAAGTVPGGALVMTEVPGAGAAIYEFRAYTNATSVQLQTNYSIIVEDIGT